MNNIAMVLNNIAAGMLCSIVAIFIIPCILERLFYYIPVLLHDKRKGAINIKSVPNTALEVAFWILVLAALYSMFYFGNREIFWEITVSYAALVGWGIGLINLLYRVIFFDKRIRKNFYHNTYARYMTGEERQKYENFIGSLNDLYMKDLEELLTQDLPYLYQEATKKKIEQLTC